MRVLLVSKACIVGQYQTKLELIARAPGIELTVVVPPTWKDERGEISLERAHLDGYELTVTPIRFNGNFHLHYYPQIKEIVKRVEPNIIHIDEEPYNLASFHILQNARRIVPRAHTLFFTWQNLNRPYPLPFAWIENHVYAHVDRAIAGTEAAARVLRAKGFAKPIAVIPQFGVDENTFAPASRSADATRFVIGYLGRLVEEKGVHLLLRALASLEGEWQARLVGGGPQLASLQALSRQLGIASRVCFESPIPSLQIPDLLHQIDVLVLPSLSRPNWIEQFGRVLIEAMACQVPLIGSTCGEIPNIVGDAGLIFPEGDAAALSENLRALMNNSAWRAELGRRGRARVHAQFTQSRIAGETVQVYHALMNETE